MRMCRYILRNKKYFIGTLCTSLFAGVVPLFLAYVIQLISDVAFNNHFEKAGTCLFASVLFLVYTLMTTSINSIMKSTYRKKLKTDLGEELYSSLMNQSYSTFKKEKIGNQLSLFTNDIKMVDEYYFYPILSMIVDIIVSVIILIYILRIHVFVGLMMVVIAVATLLVPKMMEKRLKKYSNQLSSYSGIYNSKLKEIFQNFDIILDLGVLKQFVDKGKEWIENMEYKQRNVNMAISLTGNWANCIAATFQLIFMLVIGLMILYGHLDMIYMMPIVNVSNNFISNLNDISSNLAGFKSVSDVNSKLLNIIDSHGQANKFVSNYDGNIYLEHVSFGYTESKMIIDDLSFKFEKGKKYAIVGPSGSGKSTILKMILGYYPVQKGNVSVLDSKNVSMIHQESHIFDDTIRNNLNMELVQTDETLLKCMEFVDLPEFKLDQNICEDGSNLSGGQVQRIGIARTIAHLKEVLLCDEITASLDAQTAIKIENRILDLKEETVLYVTHKYFDETLKKFDCILVFKQGRIVEQGSFEELMKNKGDFFSLKNKGRI